MVCGLQRMDEFVRQIPNTLNDQPLVVARRDHHVSFRPCDCQGLNGRVAGQPRPLDELSIQCEQVVASGVSVTSKISADNIAVLSVHTRFPLVQSNGPQRVRSCRSHE